MEPQWNDPTTWGIDKEASRSEKFSRVSFLVDRFLDQGVILKEYEKVATLDIWEEVREPASQAFTKASYILRHKCRVDIWHLLGALNNTDTPHNMPLMGREEHAKFLSEHLDVKDKSQLILVQSAMGTGKTQFLKHFFGTHASERTRDGGVIILDCGRLNSGDSAHHTPAITKAIMEAKSSKSDPRNIFLAALNDIAYYHLQKYFPEADVKKDNAWQTYGRTVGDAPVLVLDTVEELIYHSVNGRTLLEWLIRAVPCKSIVVAAATLYSHLKSGEIASGTNFVVQELPELKVLTKAQYREALARSWNTNVSAIDEKYSLPLFYYFAGGVPRHLRASTIKLTFLCAATLLGTGWRRAVQFVYGSGEEYIKMKTDELAPGEKEAMWTVALVAATKFPASYGASVVGYPGLTYALVARHCGATEGNTLRIAPLHIDAMLRNGHFSETDRPNDWPEGLDLGELYTPFDIDELTLDNPQPRTLRGPPYECVVAHSIVARWWLLKREAGAAAGEIELNTLLRTSSPNLSEYTVDLSGGLVKPGDSNRRPNSLVWLGDNNTHDMLLPVRKGTAAYTVPIQVRHGDAKTLAELSGQLEEVATNDTHPGLIVIHQTAYNTPEKAFKDKKKWLLFVDGSAFSRDDAVFAVAPFTRKERHVRTSCVSLQVDPALQYTDDDVRKAFRMYGPVKEVYMLEGMVVVCYKGNASATKAYRNGVTLNGTTCYPKFHYPFK